MLAKVDKLIIGGGMVFTFLKARGLNVGSSLVEEDQLELATKVTHTHTYIYINSTLHYYTTLHTTLKPPPVSTKLTLE
jgi:3-phosphoglycerate kinase